MIKLINAPSMPKEIKSFGMCPGSRFKPTYKYEYDPKFGCPRRVPNGEIDFHSFIQQSADDVDFKSIGKMLVDTRDNVVSHFGQNGERIVDTTLMPRNVHEYEAMHNKMKSSFDGLPADIKALFGNDFDTFAKAYKAGTIKPIFETYAASKKAAAVSAQGDGGNE